MSTSLRHGSGDVVLVSQGRSVSEVFEDMLVRIAAPVLNYELLAEAGWLALCHLPIILTASC